MTSNAIHFAPRAQDCSGDLQNALDSAAAAQQVLVLEPGVHRCGGLRLPSGLHLVLAEGAVLQLVADYDAYAANTVGVIAEDSDRAALYASNATKLRISGPGRIEAPGPDYINGELAEMGVHLPAALRPRVLVLEHCTDVVLEGFSVAQSPMWTLHMIGCRNLTLTGLTIRNDRRMPNTDGIVIDSCQGVTIRDCDIDTADDGIVLKTGLGPDQAPVGMCADIDVSACTIASRSCALKIGTESHGDFRNIRFADCTIAASNRALGIFSRDGGTVTDVSFARITLDCEETPAGYWGSGEAITVNCVDRRPGKPAGSVQRISFEDITGRMEGAVNLIADGAAGISDVTLRRVHLTQVEGRHGGTSYDVRPTHFDLLPSKDAGGRANAFVKDEAGNVIGLVAYPGGMPALYAHNIDNLTCEDVGFQRPQPLPAGWHPDAVVTVTKVPATWSQGS